MAAGAAASPAVDRGVTGEPPPAVGLRLDRHEIDSQARVPAGRGRVSRKARSQPRDLPMVDALGRGARSKTLPRANLDPDQDVARIATHEVDLTSARRPPSSVEDRPASGYQPTGNERLRIQAQLVPRVGHGCRPGASGPSADRSSQSRG